MMGDLSESDSRYHTNETKHEKCYVVISGSVNNLKVSKQYFWMHRSCMKWSLQSEWKRVDDPLVVGSLSFTSGIRSD